MTTITIEAIPTEADLIAIAKNANAKHLHLIAKGDRRVLCSIVPDGWRKVNITMPTDKNEVA